LAKEFFNKALVNFTACQHYRGMYMTEEALMDVAGRERKEILDDGVNLESYNLNK